MAINSILYAKLKNINPIWISPAHWVYVCMQHLPHVHAHLFKHTHTCKCGRVCIWYSCVYDIRIFMLLFRDHWVAWKEYNKNPLFFKSFFPLPIFRKLSFRVIINEPFSLILFNHYKVKWMQVGINLVSRIKRKSSGHEEGKLVSWLLAILLWVEVINTGLMKQTPARLSKH